MIQRRLIISTLALLLFILPQGCGTFYEMYYQFNRNFESGNLVEAEKILTADEKAESRKTKFLYYVNRGVIASMLGKYVESNEWFEKAYLYGEDYRINYLNEAVSYLTNPSVTEYRGEDHEHLALLYYKALNYLRMADRESALVECRRLILRLQQLSDRYTSDNKYRRDAFAHNLVGLIYDADRDYNNAFIAYRNAYEIYQEDYRRLFNLGPPQQLKDDLLRTAYLNGFQDELSRYEAEFGVKYEHQRHQGGEVIFLWNNGLGPVKGEWSINFAVVHGRDDYVTFVNREYNLSFRFRNERTYDEDGRPQKTALDDLEFFRVAFPKYIERPALYEDAYLTTNDQRFVLQKAEDVNAIAFKVLQERMLIEFSKGLIRVALKKAAEYQLRKENESLGATLGLINALTEKADTRNWQTLPHAIYYARMPLPVGESDVVLNVHSSQYADMDHSYNFRFDLFKGETEFHSFHSLEVAPNYLRSNLY